MKAMTVKKDLVAHQLVRYLEHRGVKHVFGLCGHTNIAVLSAMANSQLSFVMVRQPQSKANAGAFNNGMPMTSSLGCGIWGGNITNENVSLKHYMQTTWVSRPIAEDRPSEQELFGEFYGTETL